MKYILGKKFLRLTSLEKFFLILSLMCCGVGLQAQDSLSSNNRISLSISRNAYRGDLGESYGPGSAALQLSYMFNHQRRLHGGLHLTAGSLRGQELTTLPLDLGNESQANTYFRSSFYSFHYALQYDILRYRGLLLYVSQGFGLLRFVPEDEFGNSLQDQLSTRATNESYGNAAAIFPTQLGLEYLFLNHFGFGLQAGWLNTATDYLDNISQLGKRSGGDNVWQWHFRFHIPLSNLRRES